LVDAQDLLDEARDVAVARSAVYQQSLRNYHSRRVRGRSFELGNLVLRLQQTSTSKLVPPWEGPYLVDVYARFCSCRQCWASKCRGL
jgi:hypothetical protein